MRLRPRVVFLYSAEKRVSSRVMVVRSIRDDKKTRGNSDAAWYFAATKKKIVAPPMPDAIAIDEMSIATGSKYQNSSDIAMCY
jgi:hypothetical protein